MNPPRRSARASASPHCGDGHRRRTVALTAWATAAALPRRHRRRSHRPRRRRRPIHAAGPQFEARLSLVNNNGTVRYDGTVDSDGTRKAIVATLGHA